MDGIAEYRTGIFSWINNMVAAASTVASNLDLHSGMIAFVTSAHPEIRESEPSFFRPCHAKDRIITNRFLGDGLHWRRV